MAYSSYITKIKNIRKHSNADRLQVGECFGNNVIVGLDTQEDQIGIYFPSDGRLGIEYATANDLMRRKDENGNPCGGYLDPDKRNIRAIKLRGEKSDGLFMPLSSLDNFCDISTLKDGDAITVLNGTLICEKYIPYRASYSHVSAGKSPKPKTPAILYPHFAQHSDTAQLAYNLGAFHLGDRVCLTLKMHGTSQRTAHTVVEKNRKQGFLRKLFRLPIVKDVSWDYVTGTRRVVLENESGGFYGSNAFRMPHHEFFKGKLRKGEEVFYEVVGYVNDTTPIMSACDNKKIGDKQFVREYGDTTVFSYGCEPGANDIYVYRMTITNEDGDVVEYPWHLVKLRCQQMAVKTVPEFDVFDFTTTEDLLERVNTHIDGADPIGKTHIREGVVARIENRETFDAYKHKSYNFKVLEGIIKESAEVPDIEESEELEAV